MMRLREVRFRDAVRQPGTLNGMSTLLRADAASIVHDVATRLVVLGKGEDVVSVPIENVVYMVPDVSPKAAPAPDLQTEVARPLPPAPTFAKRKGRT